jgi:hypothetical protein
LWLSAISVLGYFAPGDLNSTHHLIAFEQHLTKGARPKTNALLKFKQ